METLQITTGEKRIAINGDESRVIAFNPNDVLFAEKFYRLINDFQSKLTEYQTRNDALDSGSELDPDGIPVNMPERLELLKEACTYIREKIDMLFGAGTSQKAFGDALELDMFSQFFSGMTPFISSVRNEKVAKYVNTATKPKRNGRK